ncbi:MAG TPA: 4-alpha-glucanotransferase, partial [Sphingobacteriaceae bacterium]
VDPDNRRPVNYELRQSWLEDLEKTDPLKNDELIRDLWQNRYDGRIKLWLVHTLLKERKLNPQIFEKGDYIPLVVKGQYKENVLAFARRFEETWYVVAIPLHLAQECKSQESEITTFDWKDTCVVLPSDAPAEWRHLLLNIGGEYQNKITLNTIFKNIPLAVLKLKQLNGKRSAGILMHITSLPSNFGIGDFGPEARAFAGFLNRSCQSYWQLLPLSPTETGSGHSPYSSYSSMAGNTLLLSPEMLVEEGLLNPEELKNYQVAPTNKVDYKGAEEIKNQFFKTAWSNFRKGNFAGLVRDFEDFCKKESYWLHDFALYVVLKKSNHGEAWYNWKEEFKLRDPVTIKEFVKENSEALNKEKWLQYLFFKQWKELKIYCNNLNIRLFGDLPFYVSYDSADVWSQPEIFSLDKNGRMDGVAGVPPDYFNEDGQLWGMPVFRWDKLKEQNYSWWLQRIKKNLELYDLLRLDHFRAFSAYWEVPASEETAKNGKWIPGPGADFFTAAQNQFGNLPFVAEDL